MSGTTCRPTTGRAAALDAYRRAAELEESKSALFQSVDPSGRRLTCGALERRVVLAIIKRRARGLGAAALDVLPRVPGNRDHGISVEPGDARARAADRRACITETTKL